MVIKLDAMEILRGGGALDQNCYTTRMLTRDLFAVANLLAASTYITNVVDFSYQHAIALDAHRCQQVGGIGNGLRRLRLLRETHRFTSTTASRDLQSRRLRAMRGTDNRLGSTDELRASLIYCN